MFCSDYEEDDRDESESIDNVDILSSLLISPLFNQEVSLLGTLIRCSLDWRKKKTFSSCARPQGKKVNKPPFLLSPPPLPSLSFSNK